MLKTAKIEILRRKFNSIEMGAKFASKMRRRKSISYLLSANH